jgi:hypothetical protein
MHGREDKCIYSSGRKIIKKGPVGTPRRKWENNMNMYLKEIG